MAVVEYQVRVRVPSQVSLRDLRQCIGLVKTGDAVDPESAAVEMPRAQVLALASTGNLIVGVGAIKRQRPGYTSQIAESSGVSLGPNIPEVGYIAVDLKHQGRGLSKRIVQELLSSHDGALFATTSSQRMKKALAQAGFVQKGSEWEGRKNQQLSLWIKEK